MEESPITTLVFLVGKPRLRKMRPAAQNYMAGEWQSEISHSPLYDSRAKAVNITLWILERREIIVPAVIPSHLV